MKSTVTNSDAEGKTGLFGRIKSGLSKTRSRFTAGLSNVFLGKKAIDDELLSEIETILLTSDVGVSATAEIIESLTARVARKELSNAEALFTRLKKELTETLKPCEVPLEISGDKRPYVILMVGVNGAGKTTTIGKMARLLKASGKSVLLAAGDTFRAAAVEQLRVWGERNQIDVISQQSGADSASVIYDGLSAARARGIDVLIADTAGRLQNRKNLMEELAKISRVIKKFDPEAPHEVMLVLDAGTGQNAISQAREFLATVDVTGLTLTKLDGTAKGGVIFAIAKELGLPIRYVGVGESIDDLRPFVAEEFVSALFEDVANPGPR